MAAVVTPRKAAATQNVTVMHPRVVVDVVVGNNVAAATPIDMQGVTWAALAIDGDELADDVELSFAGSHDPADTDPALACHIQTDSTLAALIAKTDIVARLQIPVPPEAIIAPFMFLTHDGGAPIAGKLYLMY